MSQISEKFVNETKERTDLTPVEGVPINTVHLWKLCQKFWKSVHHRSASSPRLRFCEISRCVTLFKQVCHENEQSDGFSESGATLRKHGTTLETMSEFPTLTFWSHLRWLTRHSECYQTQDWMLPSTVFWRRIRRPECPAGPVLVKSIIDDSAIASKKGRGE